MDMSPGRDQDYFCEGLAEELIDALTHVDGLRVAARSSSFQFRGAGVELREVGRHLGVGVVVEGSVRKAGNQLRITVQLIDGRAARSSSILRKHFSRSAEVQRLSRPAVEPCCNRVEFFLAED